MILHTVSLYPHIYQLCWTNISFAGTVLSWHICMATSALCQAEGLIDCDCGELQGM